MVTTRACDDQLPSALPVACLSTFCMRVKVDTLGGRGVETRRPFLACDLGVRVGSENSCCPRSCTSLETCKKTLDGCLVQMWDEGKIVLDTGSTKFSHETGHYLNMIGTSYTHVVCGFGFTAKGGMLSTQNFLGSSTSGSAPCNYACGTAPSAAQECGKCHGVQYCTAASQCTNPPTCFEPSGSCDKGVCNYKTPATTCKAGTCSKQHVCVQQCFDKNCGHCSSKAVGKCDSCKSGTLISGCCVQSDCVELAGLGSFSGTYEQVGSYGGSPACGSAQRSMQCLLVCFAVSSLVYLVAAT